MSTVVGTPVSRVDGLLKVTGRAEYAAEFHPEGLVYAALAESTIPAGIMRHIDVSRAERAPGVLLVLTHHNAPKLPNKPFEQRPAVEPVSGEPLRPLQDAEIRFCGQPIAMVLAKTQAQAEFGATLVRATYDRSPETLTTFELHRSRPTSEAAEKKGRGPETRQGDPDSALAEAPFRVNSRCSLPREHHNAMEPHATIAKWEGGELTVWDKTQWVYNVQSEMARVFGISIDSVRVINPFVGGAFGSALRTWPHVGFSSDGRERSQAARAIGTFPKATLLLHGISASDRTTGYPKLDLDGHLTALIHEVVGQTSTYEEFAEATLDPAEMTYSAANRRTSYKLVQMHTNTPCPMRGPGHVTGLLAQEIAMDELAAKLGIDPIELRIRNYAERSPKDDLPWSSNQLRNCYRVGSERFGWHRRNPEPRSMRRGRDLVGMGMAAAINVAPRYPTQALATVFSNGDVLVRCATSDMGPGTLHFRYASRSRHLAIAFGASSFRTRRF